MKTIELAYCAGVIDSDGCITIKTRKVSSKRGKKVNQRSYSASVFVRQVEPGAINLLHSIFGGSIRTHKPSIAGGRSLYHWEVTHGGAIQCAKALLPFLRIKHEQAKILQEFGLHMQDHSLRKRITWFKWEPNDPVYTVKEACAIKGIGANSLYQMIRNKTIPVRRQGRRVLIASRFWDTYATNDLGRGSLPDQYVALRNEICGRIRRLNGPTRGVTTASRTQP